MLVTHSFLALVASASVAFAAHDALPPAHGDAHSRLARRQQHGQEAHDSQLEALLKPIGALTDKILADLDRRDLQTSGHEPVGVVIEDMLDAAEYEHTQNEHDSKQHAKPADVKRELLDARGLFENLLAERALDDTITSPNSDGQLVRREEWVDEPAVFAKLEADERSLAKQLERQTKYIEKFDLHRDNYALQKLKVLRQEHALAAYWLNKAKLRMSATRAHTSTSAKPSSSSSVAPLAERSLNAHRRHLGDAIDVDLGIFEDQDDEGAQKYNRLTRRKEPINEEKLIAYLEKEERQLERLSKLEVKLIEKLLKQERAAEKKLRSVDHKYSSVSRRLKRLKHKKTTAKGATTTSTRSASASSSSSSPASTTSSSSSASSTTSSADPGPTYTNPKYCVKKTDVPQIDGTVAGDSFFTGLSTLHDCEVSCSAETGEYQGPTNFLAVQESSQSCWCFSYNGFGTQDMLAATVDASYCDSPNYGSRDGVYVTMQQNDFDRSQSSCVYDQYSQNAPHPTLFVPGDLPYSGTCGSSCFATNSAHIHSTTTLNYDKSTMKMYWDIPVYRCMRYCSTYTTFPAYEFFGLIGAAEGSITCNCYGEAQANYRYADLVEQIGASVDQAKCDQVYGSVDGKYMTVQQPDAWVTF